MIFYGYMVNSDVIRQVYEGLFVLERLTSTHFSRNQDQINKNNQRRRKKLHSKQQQQSRRNSNLIRVEQAITYKQSANFTSPCVDAGT